MELIEYVCTMISQEACALSKLCLENDKNNSNYEPIMSVHRRLSGFIDDYWKFSKDEKETA